MYDQSDVTVSIVISAYTEERWDDLTEAVKSLHLQTMLPSEIVLCIDHNVRLYDRARKFFPERLQVIQNSSARGLSGARNSGVLASSGNVIAFIDDDAVADSAWLEKMCAAYRDPAVLGVGGLITPLWTGGRPYWFPEEFNWVVGCSYRGLPTGNSQVRNLIGCNMSFRREVFSKIGGFQVGMGRVGALPVGCEETEFCIRARQYWPERKFLYEPDAVVFHRVPAKRAELRYFLSRCYSEGISKAAVSRLVGTNDGLSSERSYTVNTLPHGVLTGLIRFLAKFQIDGLAEAAAIIIGFISTVLGYLAGLLSGSQLLKADAV